MSFIAIKGISRGILFVLLILCIVFKWVGLGNKLESDLENKC